MEDIIIRCTPPHSIDSLKENLTGQLDSESIFSKEDRLDESSIIRCAANVSSTFAPSDHCQAESTHPPLPSLTPRSNAEAQHFLSSRASPIRKISNSTRSVQPTTRKSAFESVSIADTVVLSCKMKRKSMSSRIPTTRQVRSSSVKPNSTDPGMAEINGISRKTTNDICSNRLLTTNSSSLHCSEYISAVDAKIRSPSRVNADPDQRSDSPKKFTTPTYSSESEILNPLRNIPSQSAQYRRSPSVADVSNPRTCPNRAMQPYDSSLRLDRLAFPNSIDENDRSKSQKASTTASFNDIASQHLTPISRKVTNSAIRQFSYNKDTAKWSTIKYDYLKVTLDPYTYSQDYVKRMAAATILRFLEFKKFPAQLTVQDIFKCESTALYQTIANFLLQQFGSLPTYEKLKFDDRIPKFYKDLGYPGTLAKSHMISPCTLSTWPQHLVALTWLTCLLYFDFKVLTRLFDRSNESSPTANLHGSRTPRFLDSADVASTIGSFDINADRFTPAICSEKISATDPMKKPIYNDSVARLLKTSIDDQQGGMDSPTEAVIRTLQTGYIYYRENKGHLDQTELNKNIEPALAHVSQQVALEMTKAQAAYKEASANWAARDDLSKEINTKEDTLARLARDRQIMEETIRNAQSKLRQESQKIANVEALYEAKLAKVNFLKTEIEAVRERIRTQEVSRDELENYLSKINSLKSRLDAKKKEKNALELESRDMQITATNLRDVIQSKTRFINQALSKLQINPMNGMIEGSDDIMQIQFPGLIETNSDSFTDKEISKILESNQKVHNEDITQMMLGFNWTDWSNRLNQAHEYYKSQSNVLKEKFDQASQQKENLEVAKKTIIKTQKNYLTFLRSLQSDIHAAKKKKQNLLSEVEKERIDFEKLMSNKENHYNFDMEETRLNHQLEEIRLKVDKKKHALSELKITQMTEYNQWKSALMESLHITNDNLKNVIDHSKSLTVQLKSSTNTFPAEKTKFPGLLTNKKSQNIQEFNSSSKKIRKPMF